MSVGQKITKELEEAEKKYQSLQPETFSTKDGTKLVKLTLENVAKTEALIRIDSRYHHDDSKKYFPYWIKELGKHLGYIKEEKKEYDFDNVVENVIKTIDSENSTHLNADGVGREQMKEIIKKYKSENKLLEYLEKRNFELVKSLSAKTTPKQPEKHGRINISFASKFCHYACFHIFKGEDAQDNFSIYDSVVVNILPKYLESLGITDVDMKKIYNKDYIEYSKAIDAVIRESGNRTGEYISRNGFDHLLWYYFKGKPQTSDK